MFGGVEAGGTKFVCIIGTRPGEILETQRLEATSPAETLEAAIDFFRRAVASGTRLDAIGIGSFGPVELRRGHPGYGSIRTTPMSTPRRSRRVVGVRREV
jgi:fructokinase